jgi:hypothetical protein
MCQRVLVHEAALVGGEVVELDQHRFGVSVEQVGQPGRLEQLARLRPWIANLDLDAVGLEAGRAQQHRSQEARIDEADLCDVDQHGFVAVDGGAHGGWQGVGVGGIDLAFQADHQVIALDGERHRKADGVDNPTVGRAVGRALGWAVWLAW